MLIPTDGAKKFSGSSNLEIMVSKFLESHPEMSYDAHGLAQRLGLSEHQFKPDENNSRWDWTSVTPTRQVSWRY